MKLSWLFFYRIAEYTEVYKKLNKYNFYIFYKYIEMNNAIKVFIRLSSFFVLVCINSCYEGTQKNQSNISEDSIGLKGVITDVNYIYPTISNQDCLTWNSQSVKKEAQEYKWRLNNYYPKKGDEGIIVHLTEHCDTGKSIAILKVEENYVPIETSGIDRIN